MKIHDLHIDGFGHFFDRDFGPFDRPVTVFHGPNEAGKTTLLEFIRRILFGFPDGRSRRNLYLPLSGGRHGGSITIESDDGEIVTVRRVSGTGGGQVTLTGGAGNPIPRTELSRLLGSHSRKTFEMIFGFTLDELHDDSLLSDDSVNSQIYSAGMGATRLPDALKMLDDQKRDLFLSGGSKHAIHTTAERLDEVESDLREVVNNAAEYGRQSTRLEIIERDLNALRERRLSVGSELRHHQNLERAWDVWNDFVSAQRRLEDLRDIADFPSNGVNRLDTLNARAYDARKEMDSVVEQVRNLKESAALPIEHQSILDQLDAVRDLQRRRAAFDQSVKDVPERQAELGAMRVRLKDTLSDLGPDWDAARLTKFDLSIVVREEVSAHADCLRTAREDVSRAEYALAPSETALQEASQAAERAQSDLDDAPEPAFDDAGLRERRAALRRARNILDDHARAETRVEDLRAQIDDEPTSESTPTTGSLARMFAAALVVLGIGMIVIGAILGDSATFLGGVAGLLLVVVAVYMFVRAGLAPQPAASPVADGVHRRIAEAEQQLADLRAQFRQESAALSIDLLDADSLIAAEESLDTEGTRLTECDRMIAALRDAGDLLRQRTSHRDESVASLESACSALESAQNDWKQWLTERSLLDSFSPENIEELRRLIDLGRTHHRNVTDMERRIAAIRTDIEEFLDILTPLSVGHGFELLPDDHPRAAAVADDLIELHQQVSDQSRAKADAQNDLRAAHNGLKEREQNLKKIQQEIDDLLNAAGAQDADDFHRRAEIHAERQRLKASIDSALDQVQRTSGPGAALDALQAELARSNTDTIADDIRRVEQELAETNERIEAMVSERTTTQNSLNSLRSEEDSSRLRAERHRLREEMQSHAREWAVRTIAQNLLRAAQSKFEQDRQPDVIRHSEKFFQDITGGRYATVFSPLDESEIYVTDSAGAQKQPAQLSRGAREQLFLSLRFGLIREHSQRAERLPVIVDEVLVNFDPRRALEAAHAFIELSKTNQILVFTCHPQIVEWFVSASSERGAQPPEVIEIGEAMPAR